MKRKLTLLLTAILLLTGMTSWGQLRTDASIDFAEQGYNNGQDLDGVEIEIDDNVTIVFNKGTGSNPPKYYNTGTAIRAYGGNNFVVSSTGTISSISLTFSSGEGSNVITTDVETYTAPTWTGSSSEVTFTVGGTSGHRRVRSVSVTYTSGGGTTPTVATPTITPASGTYFEAQDVTLSCTTEGATIRYTLDETEPTESSAVYSSPISVSTTTTVKAKAFKDGYTASGVAIATYTFPTLMTIVEARALENNQYALVQGIVTFIDGKNVYIQDNTGGIDLFLTANASGVAQGDEVKAYGMKTVYKGLVELTGINQSSSSFAVLSTGNTLPLAVKTIAEVLAGGAGDLQCTRVKIESATIGTINTSGNTPLTQGESTTNIYKVPALTSINENDVVDVIGIIGYFNAPQIRVANADDVTLSYIPDPQLTVSVNQLTGFQYTYEAGPSQPKTFTVSGSDLSSDVTLTAPTDYELSHSPNNGYFNSETLSPVNGTIAETTIYVRMKAGLAVGNYVDTLTVICDTLSHSVALSGSVGEQPTVAAPTFSPAAGNFITAQTVSMSCETEGASIYYTTDGAEPTNSSNEYTEPITLSSTTTLKAIAVKSGYQNSSITEATYTINETITIAAARALADNEYACVEGVVIFIDGRNVHMQDATAGIDLYLNSNAPSSLHIGDMVRAYGKKTVYNHLVELTGINATNDNVFSVISTGNVLPEPAIQTIGEINSDFDGDNMMQSTRVNIEAATIGAINTNGNTVITQDDNSLNVYRIPSVPGMIQGDLVTLTGIVSCYNGNLQLRVVSAEDIQFAHRPTLVASPATITGLTYEYEQGGPSDIASFGLSGNNLTSSVNIYPSESFEVSTFGGNTFHPENPAMVFSNSGHFNNISIYVRMKANLEGGIHSEQIYAVSENSDTLFINVTGTVTGGPEPPTPPTPPTPGDGNYVRISSLDQLTEGSLVVFAARFDVNATDYYAMSNTSSGKPTGVLFTSAIDDEDEVLPASIVDEESSYYWTVGITANGYTFTNANSELIGYSSGTNFATGGDNTEWSIEPSTAGDGAMVPEYTGFVVSNVNNTVRAFSLNSNHNFGPYHTQNINGSGYNFYLDLFVKTEGGDPPTPTIATPTFTPAAGTYYEAQTVSIECGTAGASIYYTLDGTDPDENSTLYSTPLTLDATTTVKAIAIMEGYNNSNIAEATYTIQLGFATIFNQDWEGEMNGWTFVDVEGEMEWTIANYQGNHYAYANGYNHGANEDWCISPAFNLDAYDNPMLSFRTATKFDGNVLQVMFSNDYDGEDPTTATWTELTCALSTGNYTWVESGSIDLSSFSGSECYIGFKYTCEESQAAAWEVDDILLLGQTSEPVVTVTPLVLTGFTYMEGNGPSTEQSFTVSGLNLTGDVTINNAAHYEISLTSGTNFNAQSTITLAPVAGNIEETTIYVRLMAGLAVGAYNDEDITVNCVDVEDIEVTCSGNVTEQPVPGDDYVRISDVSQLAAGNRIILAARYNDIEDAYLAVANIPTSGKLSTTEFTSQMNGDDEIIPASILGDEDSYYWTVGIVDDGYTFTNANGDMIGYGNSGTNLVLNGEKTVWTIEASVSAPESMVPGYFGFNIINATTDTRAMALRVSETESVVKAYSTSNMTSGEYNFFLDIFMQGEGGVPPTPTVTTPTFTPAAGTYYETIDVTINCATDGATIYYSLDSESGPWEEYEEAITVDESMIIWAYATKEGYNDSPVVSAEYVIEAGLNIIFWQEWENDWDPWHGWTEVCQEGDSLWHVASYGGNHYAYANGHNHPASIDWLISPAFDLDSYSDVVLTFNTAKNYNGPDLEVFFSNDYDGQDPTTATWQELECELSQGGWNWVASGDISLDEFSGTNCYIGFKYTSEEDAAGWEVDDIKLASGSTSPTPTLIATPNYLGDFSYVVGHGPSESQSYVLSGVNLNDEGYIHIVSCSWYEISLDNETFTEILEFPCTEL
nr:chitobiase/beta-hexosaminidase C-terminal domain-containing protein [Bacteroidales bacterium]